MFDIQNFWLFIITSLLINIAPGPDMLYTAARSIGQGTRAGVVSALGIFVGCLVHITAAVFGLSAIIASSVTVFTALKMAGAAYLVFLGVKSLFSRAANDADTQTIQPVEPASLRQIFRQGVVTNLLNPKVAIFFLSFLPQFVDAASPFAQFHIAFLGLWFDIQGTLILLLVAALTGFFSEMLRKTKSFWFWQCKVTGVIFIWLGIKMALLKKG